MKHTKEPRAWMVWCPPADECDYRVYFTRVDAEIADEDYRERCATDEEDAETRTQGVIPLYDVDPCELDRLLKIEQTVRDAVSAGAIDEIYLALLAGMLKGEV